MRFGRLQRGLCDRIALCLRALDLPLIVLLVLFALRVSRLCILGQGLGMLLSGLFVRRR